MGDVAQMLTALAAVGSMLASLRNAAKIEKSNENIHKIEIATNHMKDALVQATAQASHAQGVADGKAAERANPT